MSQFILPPGQLAPGGASQPRLAYPPGGKLSRDISPPPPPPPLTPGGASCPGRFILPPRPYKENFDVYYYLQLYNNYMQFLSYNYVNLNDYLKHSAGFLIDKGWGQAVQCGLSCPPPRISERMDNQQFLLHHLLQKYLVVRDINFISVSLRCLLQTLS